MNRTLKYLFITLYILLAKVEIYSQADRIEVGIDEQLGAMLPMEETFFNSEGDTVKLGDIITKPTLLALVYYECPGICAPLLTELSWVAGKIELVPGEDFQVVSLSFDHHENPETARKWKNNYFKGMENPIPEDAWIFLTGDSTSILNLTDRVGFYFKPNEQDFVHAGTLIAVSPQGKISRYIFGLTYNQFDLKMALLEAEAGKTSPTISRMLEFCFSYDPEGRRYTLNITRIIGSIMLLAVGVFFGFVAFRKKRKN